MTSTPKTPEAAIAAYAAAQAAPVDLGVVLIRDYQPIAPVTPPGLAAAQCGEPPLQFPRGYVGLGVTDGGLAEAGFRAVGNLVGEIEFSHDD